MNGWTPRDMRGNALVLLAIVTCDSSTTHAQISHSDVTSASSPGPVNYVGGELPTIELLEYLGEWQDERGEVILWSDVDKPISPIESNPNRDDTNE